MPRIDGRDLACDPKTGLLYRPGTADKATLGYVRTDYKRLEVRPGDLVLDLGANIGAYTHLAIRQGAARVLAVEPEPECCAIWRENLIGWENRAELVEAAVAATPGTTTLHAAGGTATDGHSIVRNSATRHDITVRAVTIEELIDRLPATVIKCDIEGAEWEFESFWRQLPTHVRAIAAELHFGKNGTRQQGRDLAAALTAQKFRCLKAGNYREGGWWNTTICYTR